MGLKVIGVGYFIIPDLIGNLFMLLLSEIILFNYNYLILKYGEEYVI